jgi:hypothetical protein
MIDWCLFISPSSVTATTANKQGRNEPVGNVTENAYLATKKYRPQSIQRHIGGNSLLY